MALPVVNEVPKYKMTIPSTGQSVFYRPFLVKEQKVLMIALESQDQNLVIKSITDTLAACVDDALNYEDLATFDIEYMFSQIRSKSVGETSDISIKCSECEVPNEVSVSIADIEVETNPLPTIKLNDNFQLKLKYPPYGRMIDTIVDDEATFTSTLFQMAIGSLDKLLTDDEQIDFKNETDEEIVKFLDNMNNDQFDLILNFVKNLPKLSKDIEFKCVGCGHDNLQRLEGMQDFF